MKRSEQQSLPYLVLKPSGKWSIHIPAGFGHPQREISCRTKDRKEAEEYFENSGIRDNVSASRTMALQKRFWSSVNNGQRIATCKAIDDYRAKISVCGWSPVTIMDVQKTLDSWVRAYRIGNQPISSATEAQVGGFVNAPAPPRSFGTRQKMLYHLQGFFTFCHEREWIPINPCRDISVRTDGLTHAQLIPKKKSAFTPEEIQTLLSHVGNDDFWYGAILLANHFGLRLAAVAGLEWKSIPDYERIVIFTHKARIVVDEPLPAIIANWLRRWPRTGETDHVFPAQAARIYDLSVGKLSQQFTRICQKVGIKGKSFHCLRVTAVTREFNKILDDLGGREKAVMSALLATHGLRHVQRLVGHSEGSGVTLQRYYRPQG